MEDNMRIKKVSASEQVCEAIQEQISGGVWRVGDKLPSESELAQKFGVNRLTVRMALQKLNALGIVETRTGSGTFVIEFDFEGYLKTASRFFEQSGMMQNVTEFRNHIEIECARLAMQETPYDRHLLHVRAVALLRTGAPAAQAAKFWERIVRIDPEDSVAAYYLQAASQGAGQTREVNSGKQWVLLSRR